MHAKEAPAENVYLHERYPSYAKVIFPLLTLGSHVKANSTEVPKGRHVVVSAEYTMTSLFPAPTEKWCVLGRLDARTFDSPVWSPHIWHTALSGGHGESLALSVPHGERTYVYCWSSTR